MSDNQIHLTGGFIAEEAIAVAAISPGHLVELDSAGEVQVHSTEGGYAEKAVAVEDALQGNTIDDDYAADDRVFFYIEPSGERAQMYLYVGEDVTIGEQLISNGDGTLIAVGSAASGVTVKQIIAIALEALDLSDSGDVDTLLLVRFL